MNINIRYKIPAFCPSSIKANPKRKIATHCLCSSVVGKLQEFHKKHNESLSATTTHYNPNDQITDNFQRLKHQIPPQR